LANRIIKAIKGQPYNGYALVNIRGADTKIYTRESEKLVALILEMVAKQLSEAVSGEFDLVPIPNSSSTSNDNSEFRTLTHARAVAAFIGQRVSAVPALRWKAAKVPAHEGGIRDPQALFENLSVAKVPTKRVVLFDDVLTTGGQMIACYRRLAKSGRPPMLGMVIGRTTHTQKDNPIDWHAEDIETEERSFDLSKFL